MVTQHVSHKEELYTVHSVAANVPVIKHASFANYMAKINLRLRWGVFTVRYELNL